MFWFQIIALRFENCQRSSSYSEMTYGGLMKDSDDVTFGTINDHHIYEPQVLVRIEHCISLCFNLSMTRML